MWEKVIRKVRGGHDAAAGRAAARPPSAHARSSSWLETTLDRGRAAVARIPGRPLVHRLNRAEYANAIRDLLDAATSTPRSLLPPDDSSGGFDNNADVLGVSPVLLESYLTAAERVSALALGDPKHAAGRARCSACGRTRRRTGTSRGCRSARSAGMLIDATLPLDGEYQFQVRLFRTNLGTMRGLEYPQQLEISVDGERVHLASFGGDKEIAASSENPTTTGDDVDGRFTARVPLKAGPHHIGVAFLAEDAGAEHAAAAELRAQLVRHDRLLGLSRTSTRSSSPGRSTRPAPAIRRAGAASSSASPRTAADEEPCARRILSHAGAPRLPRRRRRRTISDVLLDFFRRGPRRTAARFETGIDLALRRMLASPKFVFRVERDPAGVAPGSGLSRCTTSSWRRGCRSSCGAAFPTTSC